MTVIWDIKSLLAGDDYSINNKLYDFIITVSGFNRCISIEIYNLKHDRARCSMWRLLLYTKVIYDRHSVKFEMPYGILYVHVTCVLFQFLSNATLHNVINPDAVFLFIILSYTKSSRMKVWRYTFPFLNLFANLRGII